MCELLDLSKQNSRGFSVESFRLDMVRKMIPMTMFTRTMKSNLIELDDQIDEEKTWFLFFSFSTEKKNNAWTTLSNQSLPINMTLNMIDVSEKLIHLLEQLTGTGKITIHSCTCFRRRIAESSTVREKTRRQRSPVLRSRRVGKTSSQSRPWFPYIYFHSQLIKRRWSDPR